LDAGLDLCAEPAEEPFAGLDEALCPLLDLLFHAARDVAEEAAAGGRTGCSGGVEEREPAGELQEGVLQDGGEEGAEEVAIDGLFGPCGGRELEAAEVVLELGDECLAEPVVDGGGVGFGAGAEAVPGRFGVAGAEALEVIDGGCLYEPVGELLRGGQELKDGPVEGGVEQECDPGLPQVALGAGECRLEAGCIGRERVAGSAGGHGYWGGQISRLARA
jgi:hypothetical protein